MAEARLCQAFPGASVPKSTLILWGCLPKSSLLLLRALKCCGREGAQAGRGLRSKIPWRNCVWEKGPACESPLTPGNCPSSPPPALLPCFAMCWDESSSADLTHPGSFSRPCSPDYTSKDQEQLLQSHSATLHVPREDSTSARKPGPGDTAVESSNLFVEVQ